MRAERVLAKTAPEPGPMRPRPMRRDETDEVRGEAELETEGGARNV